MGSERERIPHLILWGIGLPFFGALLEGTYYREKLELLSSQWVYWFGDARTTLRGEKTGKRPLLSKGDYRKRAGNTG